MLNYSLKSQNVYYLTVFADVLLNSCYVSITVWMNKSPVFLEVFRLIRKLVIISLFTDNKLMNTFVLKGGNAIDIVYGLTDRGSIDVDVSMAKDFDSGMLEEVRIRLESALISTFGDYSYQIFDVSLIEKPKVPNQETRGFWGGYLLEFKVIEKEKAKGLSHEMKRKQALVVGPGNSTKFKVDISKFEYCETKIEKELDGYTIYVYTPLMVVYEKLRAICQQLPDYTSTIKQQPRSRARDFFDIHRIVTRLCLESQFIASENLETLKAIFDAKHVPLSFLYKIASQKEFHAFDFSSIKDTVTDKSELKSFDFYFEYVLGLIDQIKIPGII